MIKAGMRADLLCVNENPLEDIKNVNNISGVMVRGKWLSKDELDLMMKRIVSSYKRKK